MKITRKANSIFFGNAHYLEKKVIFKKCNYLDFNHVVTPFAPNIHLKTTIDDNFIVNQKKYVNIVGNLHCLINCTRPNIAHAIRLLGRFISKPSVDY